MLGCAETDGHISHLVGITPHKLQVQDSFTSSFERLLKVVQRMERTAFNSH